MGQRAWNSFTSFASCSALAPGSVRWTRRACMRGSNASPLIPRGSKSPCTTAVAPFSGICNLGAAASATKMPQVPNDPSITSTGLTSSLGPASAAGESTTKWLPRALTIERPGSFDNVAVTLAVAVIGAAGAGGAAVGGTAVGGTFVGGTAVGGTAVGGTAVGGTAVGGTAVAGADVGGTAVAAWAGATGAGAGAGWQALSKSAITTSDARTVC